MVRLGSCALAFLSLAACSAPVADDAATSTANDTTSGPLTPAGQILLTGPSTALGAAARADGTIAIARTLAGQTVITLVKADGTSADIALPGVAAATIADVLPQRDGIVVAGTAAHFFLARVGADGALDPTFRPDPLNIDVADAAVTKDGKLVLAGTLHGATKAVIVRLGATGAIDTSFAGGQGAWIDDATATSATHAVVDDGGIITFITVGANGTNARRLDATGKLDASFGASPITAVQPHHAALVAGAGITYVADDTSYQLDASGNVTGTAPFAGTIDGATSAGLESHELAGDTCTLHVGEMSATLPAAECATPAPFVTLPDGRHAVVTTNASAVSVRAFSN